MGAPGWRGAMGVPIALLALTACGTGEAAEACQGIRVYPAHTTDTAAALVADPESAERFKAAVTRYGTRAEREAVKHVTRLARPDDSAGSGLVSLYVETDLARPPRIDGTSDPDYSTKSRAHDRMERKGEVIIRSLSRWWRGRDESQPEHVEPWVWVQYEGEGGSMAREPFDRSTNFCAPSVN
ncbi:putative secreted protein [Streptomyces davaonensis JCM 4913]|uniref:Putative secreted protein n=1 Tax=Streptomyces davaonensis (strain DSM 101723 / JCM 4913 / KCC S-0913 / 768) TaxID=1214101 RepID=K4QXK1_STRDJ|nr:hypothetical protein [Streptomyces davaonensis]CCK25104.1 putative secreted protein [Streptomyces davaonensis JCM 4913]